jgi:hypothetical protein
MEGPFKAGQRVRCHWANDDSVLEVEVAKYQFESRDDLVVNWAGQYVHFWDGAEGTMTFIFSKEDCTIEVVREPETVGGSDHDQ